MKVNGLMIKLMVKVNILILMEILMRVSGKKIHSMVMEKKLGLMKKFMKEITNQDIKMVLVSSKMKMVLFTLENFLTTKLKAMVLKNGKMVVNMKEIG